MLHCLASNIESRVALQTWKGRFSPVSETNFWLRGTFPKFYLFSKISPNFIRQNFWWLIFRFRISSIFSLFQCISTLFRKLFFPYCSKFPLFSLNVRVFTYFLCFSFPPTLTMMHVCITQCTYWTPLHLGGRVGYHIKWLSRALFARSVID